MNRMIRYEPKICPHPLKKITKVGDKYETICMCCDTSLGVK